MRKIEVIAQKEKDEKRMEYIGTAVTIIILFVGGVWDIRTKKIPNWLLWVGLMAAVSCMVVRAVTEGLGVAAINGLLGLLPGAGMLLLSLATEQKVGRGDGWILMLIGLQEGIEIAFLSLCIGLFLQSLTAVALLLAKKVNRQTHIPFVPFLFAARIVMCVL